MKIILNVVVGLLLFVGALVGGLAATGRLNHAGTANIPLLSSLFPEPPKAENPAPNAGDTHGTAVNADHSGGAGAPQDASAEQQGDETPHVQKDGKSVLQPEKTEGGGHGGGHGESGGEDHGAKPETPPVTKEVSTQTRPPSGEPPTPEKDFAVQSDSLARDRRNKYAPGGYFSFAGMPAGLTTDQINEAWERVKGVLADLEKRKTLLDLREKELQVLAEDIDNRVRKVAEERLNIENLQRQLDERIAKFQEQVKLVRNDEVAGLKKNARTYASFERKTAADMMAELWRSDKGQEDVLKTLEFMDKDAVDEILAAMTPSMAQDVMKKRLHVSKESASSATPGK